MLYLPSFTEIWAALVTDGHIGNVLPLHPLKKNEPYYLGVFLVGAYQEILGDMHNLFGDTNAARFGRSSHRNQEHHGQQEPHHAEHR